MRKLDFRLVVSLLLVSVIATSAIWYVWAATPTITFWVSPGMYPGAPSYTIWREGSNYFAKDANGQIDYSGTNASDVTVDAVDSSSGIILFKGIITLTSGIYYDANTWFKGEGIGATILQQGNEALIEKLINAKDGVDHDNVKISDMTIDVNTDQQSGYPDGNMHPYGITFKSPNGIISNVEILDAGIGIVVNCGYSGDQGGSFGLTLENIIINNTNTAGDGIWVTGSLQYGAYLTNIHIYEGRKGLWLGEDYSRFTIAKGIYVYNPSQDGIIIQYDYTILDGFFVNGSGYDGVIVGFSAAHTSRDIKVLNGEIYYSGRNGIHLTNYGSNSSFIGNTIANSSQSSSGTYSGIRVQGKYSMFSLNRIYDLTGDQQFGIWEEYGDYNMYYINDARNSNSSDPAIRIDGGNSVSDHNQE